jgi:hypothetical protein
LYLHLLYEKQFSVFSRPALTPAYIIENAKKSENLQKMCIFFI